MQPPEGMTFALSLKVGDGIVIAADSTSTMMAQDLATGEVFNANLYRNANKVFNLVKGLPLGTCTWGLGAIGPHSIEFLLKEFRSRLSGNSAQFSDWAIDGDHFDVHQVATRLRTYIYEEHYQANFGAGANELPVMGFYVAGVSSNSTVGEIYRIDILADGSCGQPSIVSPVSDFSTIAIAAQFQGPYRLIFGVDHRMPTLLKEMFDLSDSEVTTATNVLNSKLQVNLASPQMTMQDAIDLAEFLVEVAVKWSRFAPGVESVGGHIDIAAITKYEGFKWIRRKHFYGREFNPSVNDVVVKLEGAANGSAE